MSDRIRCAKALLLCPLLVLVLPAAIQPVRGQITDLGKTRSLAESQHEIVMILIKKKEFAKAAAEACKIFQMPWPDDQESVLLKELLGLSDQFRHHEQPEISLRLIDSTQAMFKSTKSRIAIWKDKGYVYESMGQHDKAIECFREAQRLEKSSPRTSLEGTIQKMDSVRPQDWTSSAPVLEILAGLTA